MRKIIVIYFLFLPMFVYPSSQNNFVYLQGKHFEVELAETPEQWGKGLMFRKNLDKDKGMLFIFEKEDVYSFWMKNTFIPLDIIWINQNYEIVFINRNTQPCLNSYCPSIYPTEKAKYVLEVNAGICSEIGLAVGDKVVFDIK